MFLSWPCTSITLIYKQKGTIMEYFHVSSSFYSAILLCYRRFCTRLKCPQHIPRTLYKSIRHTLTTTLSNVLSTTSSHSMSYSWRLIQFPIPRCHPHLLEWAASTILLALQPFLSTILIIKHGILSESKNIKGVKKACTLNC